MLRMRTVVGGGLWDLWGRTKDLEGLVFSGPTSLLLYASTSRTYSCAR